MKTNDIVHLRRLVGLLSLLKSLGLMSGSAYWAFDDEQYLRRLKAYKKDKSYEDR